MILSPVLAVSFKSLLMWECGLKLGGDNFLISRISSLLMWECGLKLRQKYEQIKAQNVTPYVGVWIETLPASRKSTRNVVTPYVGVWIETDIVDGVSYPLSVTPYVGVWIETTMVHRLKSTRVSLLMWECGLKPGTCCTFK